MPSKPALVFVPGAWHSPACFEPTTSVLDSQHEYTIAVVSLPSVGSELRNSPPPQNWDQDVSAIRAAVLSQIDEGRDVVLIAHSYGGCPASEAAKGLDKRSREGRNSIVRLVWISAMVLPVGGWPWQDTGGKPAHPENIIVEGDLSHVRLDRANDFFYGACSPSQQVEAKKHLCSLAWKVFVNSKVTYHAWKDIPATYLMCENDRAIPIQAQEAMVSSDKEHWKVERCDGDHSPFISRAEFTIEVIRRAAGEAI